MKWTAEVDLGVGVAVGSGKRKLGFGFGIGRRKVIRRIGIDLGEELLRQFNLFFLKDAGVWSYNWSLSKRCSVFVDRAGAMKHSNVLNLLLHMVPSSQQQPVDSATQDHWAFLEEVDAPQWVDLMKEAALMGTQGDDPWFHRSHSHHETSLARLSNVSFPGNAASVERPCFIARGKIADSKGSVPGKLKPSLKANAVKACLGGMQRVSNAGSTDGRRSSRPRLLSSSQSWPRGTKKVHIQRPLQKKVPAAGRSDPGTTVSKPFQNAGNPKKSYERKIGHLRRIETAKHAQERPKTVRDIARSSRCRDQSVTRSGRVSPSSDQSATPTGRISVSSDRSVNGLDSSKSSPRLYRLPSPQGGIDRLNSSPSDMIVSSDTSPTTSNSSQKSMGPKRLSSAPVARKLKIITDDPPEKIRSNAQLRAKSELRSRSVSVSRPRRVEEISAFRVLDRDFSNEDGDGIPDWNRQAPTPRLKRRSLGSPLRAKQIEREGPSTVKKNFSGRVVEHEDVDLPDKLLGAQTTHPILEKLRRSWGSALRVKQRMDAEVALGGVVSDSSYQNSGAVGQKTGDVVLDPERKREVSSGILHAWNLGSEKIEYSQVRSEVEIRRQPGCAATQSSEGFVFSPDSTRSSSLSAVASGKLFKSKSMGSTDLKTLESLSACVAKNDLAKIQVNNERSKPDLISKFKRQYVHADASFNKSLSLKGNKENLNSEVRMKAQVVSTTGLERKRKMQNFLPKSSVPTFAIHQPGQDAGIPQALPTVNAIGTGPQSRTMGTNRTGLACKPIRTIGHDVVDPSGKRSDLLDRKFNNLAAGSTSSLLKLTRQKSLTASSILIKEATTSAGPKGCKIAVQVADESASITAEDRKSKAALKYEPRLHSLKALKEWESKSGRRYYDLQPGERQKANQEITAALKIDTKRSSA